MSDSFKIVPWTNFTDAEWDNAAAGLGGWFYHSSYWRKLLVDSYPSMEDISIALVTGDQIRALLPLIRIARFGFSKVFSMPFSVAGPIGFISPETGQAIAEYLRKRADTFKLNCRRPLSEFNAGGLRELKTAQVDLDRDNEEIWASLPKSVIKEIKSKHDQVELRPAAGGDDLRSIQKLYKARMRILNSPGTYNDALLAGIMKLPESIRKITIARINGEIDAGFNIVLCTGLVSFYFANAILGEYPRHCLSSKLMWDDLKWAASRGAKMHYLGGGLTGTDDDSLFQFKIRWGYEARQYDYQAYAGIKGRLIDWAQYASGNRLIGLGLRFIGAR